MEKSIDILNRQMLCRDKKEEEILILMKKIIDEKMVELNMEDKDKFIESLPENYILLLTESLFGVLEYCYNIGKILENKQ